MDPDDAAATGWLALYGSLMRGLGALDSLGLGDRLRFVGPCVCRGELYDLGDYPGLRPGRAQVAGELFAVLDPSVIEVLDEFEGFVPEDPSGSLYLREHVTLVEPRETRAWIYVYNHAPDARQRVASGDWRTHLATRGEA